MTTDDSNKTKTKPATPGVKTDAGSDTGDGLYMEQNQDGNDSGNDGGSDSADATGITDNISEALDRYDEISMHINNDNQTESLRAVKGLYECFLAEVESPEQGSEATLSSPRRELSLLAVVASCQARSSRHLNYAFGSILVVVSYQAHSSQRLSYAITGSRKSRCQHLSTSKPAQLLRISPTMEPWKQVVEKP
jgi:hypothetical protein